MTKHTSGPWEYGNQWQDDGTWRIYTPDGKLNIGHRVYVEADAKLMAASPDLLAACKLCQELLGGGFTLNQAEFKLREAIFKAEGSDDEDN